LAIADRRIVECRLAVDAVPVDDWIVDRQFVDRQSTLDNPSIANRQPAIAN